VHVEFSETLSALLCLGLKSTKTEDKRKCPHEIRINGKCFRNFKEFVMPADLENKMCVVMVKKRAVYKEW
jgi:hypothetical protein